jgi:beta-barrel assembly-enhancing protease
MNKIISLLFLLSIANLNLFCDVSSDAVEKFSSPFRVEEEYYLGKAVSANLVTKYGLVKNGRLTDYISAIGNTLALASEQPSTFHGYTFGVLNTDKVLSFACPDGFIFISSGLIKKLQNEDELASVMACEIAHIVYNDPVFSVSQDTARNYANLLKSSLNSDSNFDEEIKKTFENITNEILTNVEKGYDEKTDLRADILAFAVLENSNYSTAAFLSAITTLSKSEEYAKNHPDLKKRTANVDDMISKSSVKIVINPNRTKRFKESVK